MLALWSLSCGSCWCFLWYSLWHPGQGARPSGILLANWLSQPLGTPPSTLETGTLSWPQPPSSNQQHSRYKELGEAARCLPIHPDPPSAAASSPLRHPVGRAFSLTFLETRHSSLQLLDLHSVPIGFLGRFLSSTPCWGPGGGTPPFWGPGKPPHTSCNSFSSLSLVFSNLIYGISHDTEV